MSDSYFLKRGNTFRIGNKESLDLHNALPAHNYVIKIDPMSQELFLEIIDNFNVPSKVYGTTLKDADRILSTFNSRPSSTGVLLTGEKGSGKTLLAKYASYIAQAQGVPTIVINTPLCGEKFNTFIQSIDQPAIILFDEFEKTYDQEEQEQVLTLLDGVFNSKKLFLITCNDQWKIDSHMRNRPGRIFYLLDFKGLTIEFVREYCEDRLYNKQYIDQVCKVALTFDQFNFDMLQALVEEMNRYNESPFESLRMLNTKPEFGGSQKFTINFFYGDREVDPARLQRTNWTGNPFSLVEDSLTIYYRTYSDEHPQADGSPGALGPRKDIDTEAEWTWSDQFEFTTEQLRDVDAGAGRFTFTNEEGYRLVLTRSSSRSYGRDYWATL